MTEPSLFSTRIVQLLPETADPARMASIWPGIVWAGDVTAAKTSVSINKSARPNVMQRFENTPLLALKKGHVHVEDALTQGIASRFVLPLWLKKTSVRSRF